MQMRMIHQVLASDMQNGDQPNLSPEVFRNGGQFQQGFRCGAEEKGIDYPLFLRARELKRSGKRKSGKTRELDAGVDRGVRWHETCRMKRTAERFCSTRHSRCRARAGWYGEDCRATSAQQVQALNFAGVGNA